MGKWGGGGESLGQNLKIEKPKFLEPLGFLESFYRTPAY